MKTANAFAQKPSPFAQKTPDERQAEAESLVRSCLAGCGWQLSDAVVEKQAAKIVRDVCKSLGVRDPSAPAGPPEIRRNEDGTLDEVVADHASFHLEQMDDGVWWMSIMAGGKNTHVTLYTKRNAPILATVIPDA